MRTHDRDILTVGEAIKAYREARGLSARALSLESGLSESYVGKVEAEAIDPSVSSFARIAKTLRMKPMEIYTILIQAADGAVPVTGSE